MSNDGTGKRVLEEEALHVPQGVFPCFLLRLGLQEGPWGHLRVCSPIYASPGSPQGAQPSRPALAQLLQEPQHFMWGIQNKGAQTKLSLARV